MQPQDEMKSAEKVSKSW